MSNVGKRLRKLRKEKGLTQTEVTGAQYSKEYVSQVELGKTKPSRKAVKLFAKYLDVDESYFETGVDISGHERFENLMADGDVLIEQRELPEAVRVFEEARLIGEKAESDDFMWRAEVGRAWALHMSGRHREALTILGEARVYYENKHADSMELALVLFRSACSREALGDLKLALLLLEESTRILNRGAIPSDGLRIRILRRMAAIHTSRRDLEAGREMAEAALEVGRRLGDKRAVAEAYWEAALLEERRREFAKATEYALRARDLMMELGDQQETARLLSDLGEIKNLMNKPEEAGQCFEDGLAILKSVDDPVTRSRVLNGFAETQLALGDTRRALELANKSLAIMEGRDGQEELLGGAHSTRARAFLAQGQLDESRVETEAAKRAYASLERARLSSQVLLLEGDLLMAEQHPEEAAAAYRRSSEILQSATW
jgi:transcriptional regulator with XRE-family HTH domain